MQTMKTLLIIEDTEAILENLTEYFEMAGFKIFGARNGKIGVEMAEELTPDLIICDVLMPEMDGYQVLDRLLRMAKTLYIPFIFSTSMSEKVDREEALKLGADDYIIKPFELDSLLTMVNSWLRSGSLRHQELLK
jgi:DNA-binding response OmpR family regulator